MDILEHLFSTEGQRGQWPLSLTNFYPTADKLSKWVEILEERNNDNLKYRDYQNKFIKIKRNKTGGLTSLLKPLII